MESWTESTYSFAVVNGAEDSGVDEESSSLLHSPESDDNDNDELAPLPSDSTDDVRKRMTFLWIPYENKIAYSVSNDFYGPHRARGCRLRHTYHVCRLEVVTRALSPTIKFLCTRVKDPLEWTLEHNLWHRNLRNSTLRLCCR